MAPYFPAIKEGKLSVTGRIKTENKKSIDSVKILIMDSIGSAVIGNPVYTDKKGRFKFDLPYNQKYRVYYSKQGFVSMFNIYNTRVPLQKKYKELYYDAAITLLSDSAEYNRRAISRKPFMNVAFNDGFDMFIEDLDESLAFIDDIIQPNLGAVTLSGQVQDTLQDTVQMRIVARDTLGFIVSEAITEPDGSYKLDVPLMTKVKLEFMSKDHYPAFAEVNTIVDTNRNMQDFKVEQNFTLVNTRVEGVNPAAFKIPIATIENDPVSGEFEVEATTAAVFEEALWSLKNRLVFKGFVENRDSIPFRELTVQVMDGDILSDEYELDTNYFEVPLPNNAITHVKFKSKGFHQSFVSINTNFDKAAKDTLKHFQRNIELYSRDRSDINSDAFDLPMKKFHFDGGSGNFVNDAGIEEEFIAELAKGVEIDTSFGKGEIALDCQVIDAITAKNVGKTKVRIMDQNKKVVSVINSDKSGKLLVRLSTNKVYFFKMETDGYHNTLNEFNTEVPENYVDEDHITNPFLRVLNLNTTFEDKLVPAAVSDSLPITLFYFDRDKDHFAEDISYLTTFERAVINYVPPPPTKSGKELAEEEKAKKEALMAEARAASEAAKLAATAAATAAMLAEQGKKLRVKGMVVDENNQPIEGMDIELKEEKNKITSTKSAADGTFTIIAPYDKNMQLRFEDKQHHEMFMNLTTILPEGKEAEPDIYDIKEVLAYDKKSPTVNPRAFNLPFQSLGYSANGVVKKEWVTKQFTDALILTPEVQRLAIEGKLRDGRNRTVGDAQILVYNKSTVIDTINVDKRGKFETSLAFQEEYKFTVVKDGYYSTYAAVSTSTRSSNNSDPLLDKRIKNMKLLLVNKADEDLNMDVFKRPFTRFAYNSSSGEFEELDGISEDFLADLYPEKEDKKSFQLLARKVKSDRKEGKKGNNDEVAKVGGSDAAAKRKSNQNLAEKSKMMNNLNTALMGVSNPNRARIKDVNLQLERIINDGYTTRGKQESEIDESMLDAVKQLEELNAIIASAMGFKRDAELVPIDSTFKVALVGRRYHSEKKVNVHRIYRDRIMYRDRIDDLVRLNDWRFWNEYYLNGEKINEETYNNEMARIRSTTFLIDSVGAI